MRNDRKATVNNIVKAALTKVPAVTVGFWVIKILCTTLGETGGDAVSMTWLGETTSEAGKSGLNGYLIGTAIFGLLLIVLAAAQIAAKRFNPWLYWATIVASTTAGTTLADFADRSLGVGYPGGSLLLLACVLISLYVWHRTLGSVSVNTVVGPRQETFYWITITFSQTLGTALGDWIADSGLGYSGGALVFGAGLRTGHGAAHIVQQGSGVDNLQVCAFNAGQVFSCAVNPQDMFEIMDGIGLLIPGARLFDADVQRMTPFLMTFSTRLVPKR